MFFIAVTIVAAVAWFAWLGPETARGRREQAAVNGLKGVVAIDTTWTGVVVEVHLKDADGAVLKNLTELKLPDLASVKAGNCKFTDDDFAIFAEFPRLQYLSFASTPVSDAAVTHLCKLKKLERLVLQDAGVDFKDIDRLEKAVPGINITY